MLQEENFDINMSPTSSEATQMGPRLQNEPISPTPYQQQLRAELRAEKKAQNCTADIKPFFKFYENKTKHWKYCLYVINFNHFLQKGIKRNF